MADVVMGKRRMVRLYYVETSAGHQSAPFLTREECETDERYALRGSRVKDLLVDESVYQQRMARPVPTERRGRRDKGTSRKGKVKA